MKKEFSLKVYKPRFIAHSFRGGTTFSLLPSPSHCSPVGSFVQSFPSCRRFYSFRFWSFWQFEVNLRARWWGTGGASTCKTLAVSAQGDEKLKIHKYSRYHPTRTVLLRFLCGWVKRTEPLYFPESMLLSLSRSLLVALSLLGKAGTVHWSCIWCFHSMIL